MQTTPTPSAIILSAGYSSRMGAFKPLLELDGVAAIDRVIAAYRAAGIADIHVVTGFRSAAIQEALRSRPVNRVHNPDHDAGMFSSVCAGVRALPEDAGLFFVHPVDIPLVRPHTLNRLMMAAGGSHPAAIVYPTFEGRRGHPPLIHGRLTQAILNHDGRGGLKVVLDRFDDDARDVPVADGGILLDMDTPDDYADLSRRSTAAALTEAECRALMEDVCRLPASIIAHCRQVARVAVRLAGAVNAAGGSLDIASIRAAALVHDVARLKKNHAAAGAELLRQMGFPGLAGIVAVHMQIRVDRQAPIDEAQVVHLADKLVAGNAIVSFADRFDAKLEKYGHEATAAQRIEQRRQTAQAIQTKLEEAVSTTIETILAPVTGDDTCSID